MQTPDHPPLRACPLCGRAASVATYHAAKDQPATYSVGCFKSVDPAAPEPDWDD